MSHDLDPETDGVRAFLDLTAAVDRLGKRLTGFERELGGQVTDAARAASTASEAARDAHSAATEMREAAKTQAVTLSAWTAATVAGAVLVAGLGGYWVGRGSGWDAGHAEGYREARDEQAAASWANTPAGQLALALDKAGSVGMLVRCDRTGWKPTVQDGRRVCYPYADKDGKVYGWAIP